MKRAYKLDGEICANCAAKIEDRIGKLEGVNSVTVNAMTLRFKIDAEDERFEEVLAASRKIFNDIEPDCIITF